MIWGGESAPAFAIRGTLPWHNFLSGPTAWNEEDYEAYLDGMKRLGLNYVAFHCYTGGAERYAPYVEPMIRIEYRNVVPEARLDTSLTARWGYRPLPLSQFAFGTDRFFPRVKGAEAFGARCALQARNREEHYRRAQDLMGKVIEMAHARGIQVGIGFEFGILPPEFASIVPPGCYIPGAMLPDPSHPASIEILQNTIEGILQAYPKIDWVWLWLHEHSMFIGQAKAGGAFTRLLQSEGKYFEPGDEATTFTGVWSLAYIRLAQEYLSRRAPQVRLAVSGWGGGTQLPSVLRGLDRALPTNIVLSCLSPGQGGGAQLGVLEDIARHRTVWAIPWLEGDAQLWHLQPRVTTVREQVQRAQQQHLGGVLAIHWRTEEIKANLQAFAEFARDPAAAPSVEAFYRRYAEQQFGTDLADTMAAKLVRYDRTGLLGASSPEYYPYDPGWGRLGANVRAEIERDRAELKWLLEQATREEWRRNLDWWVANLEFALLLHEVGEKIEPAYRLKEAWLTGKVKALEASALVEQAALALKAAPMEPLFRTFARRVRSRGELGELSSLNQRVWTEYQELEQFLEKLRKETGK